MNEHNSWIRCSCLNNVEWAVQILCTKDNGEYIVIGQNLLQITNISSQSLFHYLLIKDMIKQ